MLLVQAVLLLVQVSSSMLQIGLSSVLRLQSSQQFVKEFVAATGMTSTATAIWPAQGRHVKADMCSEAMTSVNPYCKDWMWLCKA